MVSAQDVLRRHPITPPEDSQFHPRGGRMVTPRPLLVKRRKRLPGKFYASNPMVLEMHILSHFCQMSLRLVPISSTSEICEEPSNSTGRGPTNPADTAVADSVPGAQKHLPIDPLIIVDDGLWETGDLSQPFSLGDDPKPSEAMSPTLPRNSFTIGRSLGSIKHPKALPPKW
ncbi:hypothetical protein BDW71DRAFT_190682 [Aspergillus fruticulosus]